MSSPPYRRLLLEVVRPECVPAGRAEYVDGNPVSALASRRDQRRMHYSGGREGYTKVFDRVKCEDGGVTVVGANRQTVCDVEIVPTYDEAFCYVGAFNKVERSHRYWLSSLGFCMNKKAEQ